MDSEKVRRLVICQSMRTGSNVDQKSWSANPLAGFDDTMLYCVPMRADSSKVLPYLPW